MAFEVREKIRSEERGKKKLVNQLIKEVTESVILMCLRLSGDGQQIEEQMMTLAASSQFNGRRIMHIAHNTHYIKKELPLELTIQFEIF